MFPLQKSVLLISIGSGLVAFLLMVSLPNGSLGSTVRPRSEKPVVTHFTADPIGTEHTICQLGYDGTLNGLEKRSDAVVVGRPTQHLLEREHHPDWTRGTFVVERVLSRKGGTDLVPGKTISLAEPVGLAYYRGIPIRLISDFCFGAKKDSQYVVFINRGTDGTYGTHNYRLGRFNTDGTDCEDEMGVENGKRLNGDRTDKQKLRDEIAKRYGVRFAPVGSCASPKSPPAE